MKKFLKKIKKFLRTCKCKCMLVCCKTKMECRNDYKNENKIKSDSLTNLAIRRPIDSLNIISINNI